MNRITAAHGYPSNTFTVKAFTGPCWVQQYADLLRDAGMVVVEEGTEHVYVASEGSEPSAAAHNAEVEARRHGIEALTFRAC